MTTKSKKKQFCQRIQDDYFENFPRNQFSQNFTLDNSQLFETMKALETSESKPISVDILTSDLLQQPGQIGMTIAPGRQGSEADVLWNRNLQADLQRLRTHYDVERLVCLLEAEELHALGIPDLLAEAEANGLTPEHLPIPDDGLPDSIAAFSALVNKLVKAVRFGETILIHCKGGRGRTGMLAAACLVELGYSSKVVIANYNQRLSPIW